MRHQKVREREKDKKLLKEGLSRKSETKTGRKSCTRQKGWSDSVEALCGVTRHDDGDDD